MVIICVCLGALIGVTMGSQGIDYRCMWSVAFPSTPAWLPWSCNLLCWSQLCFHLAANGFLFYHFPLTYVIFSWHRLQFWGIFTFLIPLKQCYLPPPPLSPGPILLIVSVLELFSWRYQLPSSQWPAGTDSASEKPCMNVVVLPHPKYDHQFPSP